MKRRDYHRGYDEEAAKVSMASQQLGWSSRAFLAITFIAAVLLGMALGSLA